MNETMKFALEHIGLPARDPKALAQWYEAILAAKRVGPGGDMPPFFVALPDGPMLEIYAATSALAQTSDNGLAGFRHLALRVESIETARIELVRRGVAFSDPVKPAAGGGRVLFFRDAEGNLLHLVERPEGSAFPPNRPME